MNSEIEKLVSIIRKDAKALGHSDLDKLTNEDVVRLVLTHFMGNLDEPFTYYEKLEETGKGGNNDYPRY